MLAFLVLLYTSVIVLGNSNNEEDNSHFNKLYIYTWEVFPDMAVFDWYIRLADKERLSGCDLSFGPENSGNTTILENFLPAYRTFKISPLISNTSYWTYLVCRDTEGGWLASETLNFTTGKLTPNNSSYSSVTHQFTTH